MNPFNLIKDENKPTPVVKSKDLQVKANRI